MCTEYTGRIASQACCNTGRILFCGSHEPATCHRASHRGRGGRRARRPDEGWAHCRQERLEHVERRQRPRPAQGRLLPADDEGTRAPGVRCAAGTVGHQAGAMNVYDRDDRWQRDQRNRFLRAFFKGYSDDGRYVLTDKGTLATLLQKRAAVDVICQLPGDVAEATEHKIVRWPGYVYPSISIETVSCSTPGMETPGWIRSAGAERLMWCFGRVFDEAAYPPLPYGQKHDHVDWLGLSSFNSPQLQAWFRRYETTFKPFGPLAEKPHACGRVVRLRDIQAAGIEHFRCAVYDPVEEARHGISDTGEFRQAQEDVHDHRGGSGAARGQAGPGAANGGPERQAGGDEAEPAAVRGHRVDPRPGEGGRGLLRGQLTFDWGDMPAMK